MCPLIILVVAKTMRMNTVISTCYEGSVAEMDYDFISHFRADNRSEDAEPLWLRLRPSEGVVRILNVANLGKNVAIGPWIWDRTAMNEILVARSKVPHHILGLDVVVPRPSF